MFFIATPTFNDDSEKENDVDEAMLEGTLEDEGSDEELGPNDEGDTLEQDGKKIDEEEDSEEEPEEDVEDVEDVDYDSFDDKDEM